MAKTKEAQERRIVGYRYTGDGAYFSGIPRRDLATADLVRFAAMIEQHVVDGAMTQLYEPIYEDEVTDNG